MKYKIRQEKQGDEAAIAKVIVEAFAGKPYSDGREAEVIDGLRNAGALVLSLVAVARSEIIGQVALSPATIGDLRYLTLGPLAVLPAWQGQGIGSDLMGHALGVAQAYGRDGVVLMGDPAYYGRFGFRKAREVVYTGEGADFIQVLPFTTPPEGQLSFHPAF